MPGGAVSSRAAGLLASHGPHHFRPAAYSAAALEAASGVAFPPLLAQAAPSECDACAGVGEGECMPFGNAVVSITEQQRAVASAIRALESTLEAGGMSQQAEGHQQLMPSQAAPAVERAFLNAFNRLHSTNTPGAPILEEAGAVAASSSSSSSSRAAPQTESIDLPLPPDTTWQLVRELCAEVDAPQSSSSPSASCRSTVDDLVKRVLEAAQALDEAEPTIDAAWRLPTCKRTAALARAMVTSLGRPPQRDDDTDASAATVATPAVLLADAIVELRHAIQQCSELRVSSAWYAALMELHALARCLVTHERAVEISRARERHGRGRVAFRHGRRQQHTHSTVADE